MPAPQLTPDFIAKIAFDPSSRFHAEVGGIVSTFKIINTANLALGQTNTKAGGGILFGMNGEIFKGFRLITTNFWSDGEGRYLFRASSGSGCHRQCQLEPAACRRHGGWFRSHEPVSCCCSAITAGSTLDATSMIDTNGKLVGYGYTGSANSQNKAIQEITFGFNETMWANPRYGAINLIGQYEYLTRNPWYIATDAPEATHDNTILLRRPLYAAGQHADVLARL